MRRIVTFETLGILYFTFDIAETFTLVLKRIIIKFAVYFLLFLQLLTTKKIINNLFVIYYYYKHIYYIAIK